MQAHRRNKRSLIFLTMLLTVVPELLLGVAPTQAARKTISFEAKVKELSMFPEGKEYRVAFQGRAAYYRATGSGNLIACVEKSVRNSEKVRIEAEHLHILRCSAVK